MDADRCKFSSQQRPNLQWPRHHLGLYGRATLSKLILNLTLVLIPRAVLLSAQRDPRGPYSSLDSAFIFETDYCLQWTTLIYRFVSSRWITHSILTHWLKTLNKLAERLQQFASQPAVVLGRRSYMPMGLFKPCVSNMSSLSNLALQLPLFFFTSLTTATCEFDRLTFGHDIWS